jgi:putative ABC transport system permease protein
MGGSKSFIVGIIETEALVLAGLGIVLGGLVSLALRWLIMSQTSLIVEFEWQWIVVASSLAVAGGMVGALYPALKAAHQDPVEALSYE